MFRGFTSIFKSEAILSGRHRLGTQLAIEHPEASPEVLPLLLGLSEGVQGYSWHVCEWCVDKHTLGVVFAILQSGHTHKDHMFTYQLFFFYVPVFRTLDISHLNIEACVLVS